MTSFDDIRPYHDHEVPAVLARLINDTECLDAVLRLRYPRMPRAFHGIARWLVRRALGKRIAPLHTVKDFQMLVERLMQHMIDTTTTRFTCSGLDALAPGQAYLFISNHRDIALDPAFVNYALFHAGHDTVRIAIGDNLLSKPFVSDLMRLNKSFIVKRSISSPKQLLAALKTLSAYIRHSLQQDNQSVWIAQREGRAKDGVDRSEPAIIKMITISQDRKQERFEDFVRGLCIVPVSISYEYDPCDAAKARELHAVASTGGYQKQEHEDIGSIAAGITGQKGHVHLSFGEVMTGEYSDPDAVATALDTAIVRLYRLHPSNAAAWRMLNSAALPFPLGGPELPFGQAEIDQATLALTQRLSALPEELHARVLKMYAAPLESKRAFAD